MNNSHINQDTSAKEDYNKEPVFYCAQCLSLRIKSVPMMEGMDYCDECNSTNIEESSIEEWEARYKERYGHRFLEKPIY